MGCFSFNPVRPQRWGAYSVAFMWCPGVAAMVTQFLMRRSVRGLGWGWDGLRYYLLAYGLPIAICLAAYLPVWLGFDAFRPEALAEAATKLRLPAGMLGNLGLALFVLTQPLLGMIGSLGEELVTKLVFLKPISGKSCGTRNALRQPQGRIALLSRLMKPM